MSIRGFLRALVRGEGATSRPPNSGDELAETIRDAVGAQGGGGGKGGRMTGSAVYKLFENRKRGQT